MVPADTLPRVPSPTPLFRSIGIAFDDGAVLSVTATRPPGAEGHGDEVVSAVLLDPERGPMPVAEVLLSTEYDEAGAHQRATLELHLADEGPPLRGSGSREGGSTLELDGTSFEVGLFAWTLEGTPGRGHYAIAWRPQP